jgi:copper resistance protein C
MRRVFLAIAASALFGAAAPAMAQSHDHGAHGAQAALSTTPTDGAAGPAPSSFSATFEHAMRLTNLVVIPRGGDPIAVTVPAGAPSTTVTVALPPLTPGNYTFAWTAIGADNHTMTGRVRYAVH